MPRGFLVKRHKKGHQGGYSWRRRGSEEAGSDSERSVSGSEQGDCPAAPSSLSLVYSSSPDSGYSHSPVSSVREGNENLAPRPPARPPLGLPPPLTSTETETIKDLSPGTRTSESPAASSSSSSASSPLSVHTPASLGSPPGFQFSAFDRLSVCSPQQTRIGTAGPLFHPPLSHLLPPAHSNGNYLTVPQSSAPPGAALLLQPAMAPFKSAGVPGVLSPVNCSQPPRARPLLSSATYSPAPQSPSKKRSSSECSSSAGHQGAGKPAKSAKKSKAIRKIQFDEDKSSPVSGTIIKDAADVNEADSYKVCSGDIDSSLNLVEVTAEARADLQKIDNKIGDYICQLCRDRYEDAFQLAQHKCSRIVHVEYRCPECDKVFNCPANLASHRRWHKPRQNNANNKNSKPASPTLEHRTDKNLDSLNGNYLGVSDTYLDNKREVSPPAAATDTAEGQFECRHCSRRFKREAYLRKHEATHQVAPQQQQEEGEFVCHYCGKGHKTEAGRTKHILQQHTPGLGGPHHYGSAPTAPLSMPSRSSPPAYNCAICSQPFPSHGALERHQRLHTTDMFSCKYCTSVFYSSPGLTRHINKCHPSENRQVILLQMPPQVNRTC